MLDSNPKVKGSSTEPDWKDHTGYAYRGQPVSQRDISRLVPPPLCFLFLSMSPAPSPSSFSLRLSACVGPVSRRLVTVAGSLVLQGAPVWLWLVLTYFFFSFMLKKYPFYIGICSKDYIPWVEVWPRLGLIGFEACRRGSEGDNVVAFLPAFFLVVCFCSNPQ